MVSTKTPKQAAQEIRSWFFVHDPIDPHTAIAKAFVEASCSACHGNGFVEKLGGDRPYLAHCECVKTAIRKLADELAVTGATYQGPGDHS